MNLLCPNCQKPLSVPDQYAGQPMRCPLCAGTFTVPALPQTSAPPPPPPPAAAPSSPPRPPDVYDLRDPAPPPPSSGAPLPVHELDLPMPPPSPHGDGLPPPPPLHYGGPPPAYVEEQPAYPATPVPEGYQRRFTIWFSPKYLQYVAPVAVFLVLVLSFFSWTGIYPGGVADVTQNAWQAAFGAYSVDTDVGDPFATKDDARVSSLGWETPSSPRRVQLPPVVLPACVLRDDSRDSSLSGAGVFAVVHAAGCSSFHPALALGRRRCAEFDSAVFPRPANGVRFQSGTQFHRRGGQRDRQERAPSPTTPDARRLAIFRGEAHQTVSRTVWLDLTVLFLILAVLGAGLTVWVQHRGGRPAPRIDLLT